MKKMFKVLKPIGAIALAATIFVGNLSFGFLGSAPDKAEAAILGGLGVDDDWVDAIPTCVKGLNADGTIQPGAKLSVDFAKLKTIVPKGAWVDEGYSEWHYFYAVKSAGVIDGIMRKGDGGSETVKEFQTPASVNPGSYVEVEVYVSYEGASRNYHTSPAIKFAGHNYNLGGTTLNLANGPVTLSAYDFYKDPQKIYAVLTPVIATLDGSAALKVSGLTIFADLDNDGNFDIQVDGLKEILDKLGILYLVGLTDKRPVQTEVPEPELPENPTDKQIEEAKEKYMQAMLGSYTITLTAMPTSSLRDSYMVSLPALFASKLDANAIDYYSSTTYIVPSMVVNSSLKAPTIKSVSAKGKKVTVALKKIISKADGYEIELSKDKNFTKVAKTVDIDKAYTLKKKFKMSKGTYYVRVRSYTKSGNAKAYSEWSKKFKKKVVVKK